MLMTSRQKLSTLMIAMIIFFILIGMSIVYGYTDTTIKTAISAFTDFNGSNEHIIIESVRLPRSFIAATVGSCLAMAGVIMQTLTKNPLASPSILGVNAGAGFALFLPLLFSILLVCKPLHGYHLQVQPLQQSEYMQSVQQVGKDCPQ